MIGDHTDQAAICMRPNGVLYTEVQSKGVMINRVRIIVDTTADHRRYHNGRGGLQDRRSPSAMDNRRDARS